MRSLRTFLFIFLGLITLCSAGKMPSYHGVQGSYEASSDLPASVLKPLIILDPGHGGPDEGTKVNSFMEKKLNLTTAFLVKKNLEKMGYRVSITRSRDVYVPLPRRVSIANKAKAALFVSVHFNSSPSAQAQGIEIFYFDSKELWRTKASKRLGSCILQSMLHETGAVSRGIKQGNFHVIRETDMPAVLVEGGFMTNRDERAKLKDKAYLERMASGIAHGIDRYMRS